MIAKKISYDQLKEAIRIGFVGDDKIFEMYDKRAFVNTLDELVSDISRKVGEYEGANYIGVYENRKLVGYYVYWENSLVSFALNVNYRIRKYLKDFWRLIRTDLKGLFFCQLWSRNIRAVKFMQKMGMKIAETNPHVTILVND